MKKPSFDTALNTLKNISDDFSSILPFKQLRMPRFEWPQLRIGNLVAKVPIIQGGMGVGISLSGLASAVAEAGGIGVIAANGIGILEKDYFKNGREAGLRAFRREIRSARAKTKGILGVNIMVAVNDFHQMLDVAIDEKIDLIIMGAGLPIKDLPVDRMRENGVKAIPIVSSARAAEMIFRMWKKIYNDVPDAVVFEGPLAGGHIGFSEEQIHESEYQMKSIVPNIVEAMKPFETEFGRSIPVIAAGGIYSGEDIHEALSMGASAVQMGTRFVATDECDADEKFKQAYVDCSEDQIGIIKSPVGMPGRAIRNDFIVASEEGRRPSFKCAWQCLASCKAESAQYCISIALNNARQGKLSQGFVFAGANAYRIKEIVPVVSLVHELAEGYKERIRQDIAGPLETLVARIQDLRKQYDGLGIRVKDLGLAYEKALSIRMKEARDSGLDKIRNQYDKMLGRARELQFQILEGLADSWAMLNQA